MSIDKLLTILITATRAYDAIQNEDREVAYKKGEQLNRIYDKIRYKLEINRRKAFMYDNGLGQEDMRKEKYYV